MNSQLVDKIKFSSYDPFTQFDNVKQIWTSMLEKCSHSYYLSWAWTETWLKSLPLDCEIFLLVGVYKELPVIAFFLGLKSTTRHKFFKYKQVALNQTLIPDIDIIWIEYNSILIDPKFTIPLDLLVERIPIRSWDEFRMIRCSSIYQPNLTLNSNLFKKYNVKIYKRESYYVNLCDVRNRDNNYLNMISQNKRQQIRRSIKEFEKMGDIHIDFAENKEEALKIFDNLCDIHQKRWTAEGHPGALSNEYIITFHRNLINKRFDHGEIQLIKISAGDFVIGCLYNLIYDGKVYFYICGFNYLPANVYRPGLVCHYYAIIHNAKLGLSSYDFLEGEDVYRKSLSTNYNEMETIIIKRKSIRSKMEEIILLIHDSFKNRRLLINMYGMHV